MLAFWVWFPGSCCLERTGSRHFEQPVECPAVQCQYQEERMLSAMSIIVALPMIQQALSPRRSAGDTLGRNICQDLAIVANPQPDRPA